MKEQLQQISSNKKSKRLIQVLSALTLMLTSQFCGAQTAYITNNFDNTVSVIDVATNTVINTVKVGAGPFGVSVSPDGSKVYVANNFDNTVSVINTPADTVLATITVGSNPFGVSVSPDGSNVYITNERDNTISVINTVADTVSSEIIVDGGSEGIAVSPDGSTVYVSNNIYNTVSVINTAAGTVSTVITVGDSPTGICLSPDGSKVYVANSGDSTVSVISTATNTISDTIKVGPLPLGISGSPDGSMVYVTNGNDNTVSVISASADTVLATISVGFGPYGVSVSPDGAKVYIANLSDNTVSVINTATNAVSDTIPVGYSPIAFGNFISSIKVSQPCSLTIVSQHSPSCYSCSDGSITTKASGGTPPYTYTWTPAISVDSAASGLGTGSYIICITDSKGCYTCDSVTLSYPLLVQDLAVDSLINLYPNPATNQLIIHSSAFRNEGVVVKVVDVLGRETSPQESGVLRTPPTPLQGRGESATIDVSGLSAGMYFVEMKWEGGSVVKRFVKE